MSLKCKAIETDHCTALACFYCTALTLSVRRKLYAAVSVRIVCTVTAKMAKNSDVCRVFKSGDASKKDCLSAIRYN
jgi:hypothetical protein